MLHIWKTSGNEQASLPVEELSDVRTLKQHLQKMHGLAPRFRQRLLFRGTDLPDDAKLESPMDVELVLLSFSDASREQVEKLTDAAKFGCIATVEALLTLPQNPNLASTAGDRPLPEASQHLASLHSSFALHL